MRREAEIEQLKALVAADQLMEVQAKVTEVLTEDERYEKMLKKPSPKNYALRNLASVAQVKTSDFYHEFKSKRLFQTAKKHFKGKQFQQAALQLKRFVKDYSSSPNIVQGYFLLTESLYFLGQYDEMAAQIDQMATLFPLDELTGHSLLRLASIYEEENRIEDAIELCLLVEKKFNHFDNLVGKAHVQRRRIQ